MTYLEDNTAFGSGALAYTVYFISGGFSKLVSLVDRITGEIPKDELTLGELLSLLTAAGVGVATYGLVKLINYYNKESQKPNEEASFLFKRLE